MENTVNTIVKGNLIEDLTVELRVLRAKLGISQERLSELAGISRQTYSALESKKRKMSWSIFLALITVFAFNDSSQKILIDNGISERLKKYLEQDQLRAMP